MAEENLKAQQTQADQNDSDNDDADSQQKQIVDMGSVTAEGKHLIHCLTIIGQVEGHYILPPQNKTTKYEHVLPQLVAIEESKDIKGLLILLNTVGGDVKQVLPSPSSSPECRRLPSASCWAEAIPSECRWRCRRKNPSSCRRLP